VARDPGVCGAPTTRGVPCQAPRFRAQGVTGTRCKLHGGPGEVATELERRRAAALPPTVGPDAPGVEVPRSLEELVTGERYAGLAASPLQLATVRLADGYGAGPELADAELERYLGSVAWRAPAAPPRGVCLVAGVRGGKSRLAVCAAIWGALRADLSGVESYEPVLAVVVGPTVRASRQTFRQLLGVMRRPGLRDRIVGKPTADAVVMRRPDGREVTLTVVPATAGGESVRGVWLAAIVVEEAASWRSETEGAAVSAEDTLDAASTRVLPGGQRWVISSPGAPSGLLHDIWRKHFGAPPAADTDGRVPWLVVHAPTQALNPTYPTHRIEAMRRENPDKAAREHDAAWTSAVDSWIPHEWVTRAVRPAPGVLPRERGCTYVAAMDPATRGNGWCLVVGTRRWCVGVPRMSVVLAHEWRGSQSAPLDPARVLRELAEYVRPYGVSQVLTDQWAADSLRALSRELGTGVSLVERAAQGEELREMYEATRLALALQDLELPAEPAEIGHDLRGARRVLTPAGIRIEWARTSDGRHGDFGPALARCVRGLRVVEAPPAPAPARGTPEARAEEARRDEDAEDEAAARDWRGSKAWRGHRRRR
jgi:hypothetical protein